MKSVLYFWGIGGENESSEPFGAIVASIEVMPDGAKLSPAERADMAFMSPQPAALIEIAAQTESREAQSAEDRFGSAVVPLPFELSARDREDYFRAIIDPPTPSDNLRRALAEYREFFAK